MLLIVSSIIIRFNVQNIYKLLGIATSKIKAQEKYFSNIYTLRFRKSECQIYQNWIPAKLHLKFLSVNSQEGDRYGLWM